MSAIVYFWKRTEIVSHPTTTTVMGDKRWCSLVPWKWESSIDSSEVDIYLPDSVLLSILINNK